MKLCHAASLAFPGLMLFFFAGPAAAQYVDTNSSCIQCHESGLRQNDFCAAVSAEVWLQDDKHRRAFWLLHESDPANAQKGSAKRALVRQMLGFELAEAFTDERYLRLRSEEDAETVRKVAAVKACLRCHATWPKEADEEFAHDAPVPLELGVSCQACHGPGEKWDQPHRLVAWRAVTPEAKASLGFYDCRSAGAKAKLCASCHIGSIAEGKFVKHEWYAAGHPPLPGFELASFQQQMPRHWTSLREKGAFALRDGLPGDAGGQIARQVESLKRSGIPAEAIKGSYLEANFTRLIASGIDPKADFAAAKDAVIGGTVVLETYVRLVGEYGRQAADGEAAWPELALFDCAACHHELRGGQGNAARPQRRSAPGRPPLATWTKTLAPLAAYQAAGYDESAARARWADIDVRLEALERAITSRPFGDAEATSTAAGSLAEALAQLRSEAAQTSFSRGAATNAVQLLAAGEVSETNDFASARQAAWAITAIYSELGYPNATQLFDANDDDPLSLKLPSGSQGSIMENLHRWLPAAAKYDPGRFRDELSGLREK